MCSVLTCSHLWREQHANGGPANSGELLQMPVKVHSAGLWAQVQLEHIVESVFECLACWRSFCFAIAVFLLFLYKAADTGPAAGSMPSYSPLQLSSCNSQSPGISSMLCAGRNSKPSFDCTSGCAVFEELDYLCNLIGLWVPPHATSNDKTLAEHKTREGSVRKDQERVIVCDHHFPFRGLSCFWTHHCTCCHFHLHQSRWNWSTISCAS